MNRTANSLPLKTGQTEIRIRGKDTQVPSVEIGERTLLVTGNWIKRAEVHDEAYVIGEIAPDPELLVSQLKRWEMKPDVFIFSQKIPDLNPKHAYPMEWDNFAVIPITTYEDWLKNRAKKDVKENLRRSKREGVVVRITEYDDAFVRGIKEICDESPFRQGMKFWHYQKSLEDIRKVHGTYKERSEYIGAYLGDELIGFVKMVYVGNYAKTMNVISKERYFQKRPSNALIAKAVEVCAQKGISYFIYGEYRFAGKKTSSLADFKKRNGFEEFRYPRYFVPLTGKGRLYISSGLHRGIRNIVPAPMIKIYLKLRSHVYDMIQSTRPGARAEN